MPNYGEDFYKKENIIGYTGNPHTQPTVYFRDGDRFGRITQAHGNPRNVGRNLIREHLDYQIANTGVGGKAQEFYGGQVHHDSRNPFVEVAQDSEVLDGLATAIINFPDIKPKYQDA